MFAEKVVLLLIIIYMMIKAETPRIEPALTTKSATASEGRDLQLSAEYYDSLWFDWYYNTTMICQTQGADGYLVNPSYQGKVEQCNKTGIHLRYLSVNDTGNYSLQSYIEKIQAPYNQMMFLTVLASPTKRCTPTIEVHSKDVFKCSTPCANLYPEWKLDKTGPAQTNWSFLPINCSWKVELLWCCPQGLNMRCYEGINSDLCTSINYSSYCSEDSSIGNGFEIHPAKAPGSSDMIPLVVGSVIGAVIVIVVVIITIICCYTRKRKKRQEGVDQLELKEEADFTPTQEVKGEADSIPTQLFEETSHLLEEKDVEDSASVELCEQPVPQLATKQAANYTPFQLPEETVSQLEKKKAEDSTLSQPSDPEHETIDATTEHKPSTDSKTKRELQELRHAAQCKICFANKMSMVFMPCNHIATCVSCSISLQQCPVCRALIQGKMNIRFD